MKNPDRPAARLAFPALSGLAFVALLAAALVPAYHTGRSVSALRVSQEMLRADQDALREQVRSLQRARPLFGADSKITALTAAGTLHSDDILLDVDVHDPTMASSGTDKRLTFGQFTGAFTGDVTYSGFAGTIANGAVTPGKMASGTPNSLLGYSSNGTVGGVTVGSGLSLVSGTLTATSGGGGSGTVGTGSANQLGYYSSSGTTLSGLTLGTNLSISGGVLNASGGSGSGTVTSVGLTMPTGFAVASSPVTTSGTIAVTTSLSGLLKASGGAFSAATAGTDYQAPITLTTTGTSGAATFSGNTLNIPQYTGGGGSGTITTVSVASANGFAGTVANASSTPAITLTATPTGILKSNGTAISAASSSSDYQVPITLTTTGTSGAATFTSGTLNIPQYTGGSGSGTVNTGTTNTLAFYAANGAAVSPLTLGTNLSITGTTLNAAGGGGSNVPTGLYSQIVNATNSGSTAVNHVSTAGATGTPTIPAGQINVTGRTIVIEGAGIYSVPAGLPTLTVYITFDGSTVMTSAAVAPTTQINNSVFTFKAIMTVKTTGASGTIDGFGAWQANDGNMVSLYHRLGNGTTAGTGSFTTPVTVDLTAAHTVGVNTLWSTTGASLTFTNLTITQGF